MTGTVSQTVFMCVHVCVSVCVAELQTIIDGLLTDKLLLVQQIDNLTKEGLQLREQVLVCACVCVHKYVSVCVFISGFSLLFFFTARPSGGRERDHAEGDEQTEQDHE